MSRLQIDAIDAHPVPHDHPGRLHRSDDVRVERGELRDHRIGVGDEFRKSRDRVVIPRPKFDPRGTEDGFLDLK